MMIFYCLNWYHSFGTKYKLESHEKICENKDFCNVIAPSEGTKILEFNQFQKPDKEPFIIYKDRLQNTPLFVKKNLKINI